MNVNTVYAARFPLNSKINTTEMTALRKQQFRKHLIIAMWMFARALQLSTPVKISQITCIYIALYE